MLEFDMVLGGNLTGTPTLVGVVSEKLSSVRGHRMTIGLNGRVLSTDDHVVWVPVGKQYLLLPKDYIVVS